MCMHEYAFVIYTHIYIYIYIYIYMCVCLIQFNTFVSIESIIHCKEEPLPEAKTQIVNLRAII